MNNIDDARQIALIAHKGQIRKNGESYINHCIRVSEMAKEHSPEAAIVGMLHDVIEDSNINYKYLERYFDIYILGALHLITKRKEQTYLNYILNIKQNLYHGQDSGDWAYQVKLCDLEDNLNGATGTLRDKYLMAYYILTEEEFSND